MSFDLQYLVTSFLTPGSASILFLWSAVGLTVAAGALDHRRLRARFGEARGMLLYFSGFFGLFAAAPIALILTLERDPLAALAAFGLQAGNVPRGLLICAGALPVTMLLSLFVSREPAMREQYPFSKAACADDVSFILYEASYVGLYYSAWEFLYRGILFFPLLHALGFPAAAALTTALSTLHHIGHPRSEIAGALAGGLIFSTFCLLTDSFLTSLVVHAMMGVGNDTFLYVRWHRRRPAMRR